MIDYLFDLVKEKLHETLSNDKENNGQYRFVSLKISLQQPIPLSATNIEPGFFLCKPDSSQTLLGLGSFITIKTQAKERFQSIKAAYNDILKDWKDKEHCTPIAFHAFAFDEDDSMTGEWSGLDNTLLTIPLILFKEVESRQTLFINIDLHDGKEQKNYINELLLKIKSLLKSYFNEIKQSIVNNSDLKSSDVKKPKPDIQLLNNPLSISWLQLTKKAIHTIHSGCVDKIVTSRQFTLNKQHKISIPRLIKNLIKNYPSCTILSYQFSGKTIITASPEQLLSLDYPNIKSDAIGGTIHRNTDKKHSINGLSQSALADKNRLLKEHDFIVQAIYQGLDSLCHTLKMPVSPFLMKLHNMYHLETPIQGKLIEQYDLFDAIETLHPTPAVAGYPSKKAKQWLLDNEGYQRGWYTGAFGYLENNAQGKTNGELSVMLRCAIINKNKMTLFAGAGLVAESEPEMEWQETELKMQTILEMI